MTLPGLTLQRLGCSIYTNERVTHTHMRGGPTEVPKLETEAAPISKPERPPYNGAASDG